MEILNIPCISTPTDCVELKPYSNSRLMITTHDDNETAQQLAQALTNWVNEQ